MSSDDCPNCGCGYECSLCGGYTCHHDELMHVINCPFCENLFCAGDGDYICWYCDKQVSDDILGSGESGIRRDIPEATKEQLKYISEQQRLEYEYYEEMDAICENNIRPLGKMFENMTSQEIKSIKRYIYFLYSKEADKVKIGITKDLKKRLKQKKRQIPGEVFYLYTMPGTFAMEKMLHIQFKKYSLNNEWFHCSGEIREYIDFCQHGFNPLF